MPGTSSSGPRESSSGPTASAEAIESPVFTTRSGSSEASDLTNAMSRCLPGVRWMSEICSTRSGSAAGGSTGTSCSLSANQLRSMTEA